MCRPLLHLNYKVPPRRPKMINGDLGINFFEAEMEKVVEDLKFALVLKFIVRRPPIDVICQHIIKSWKFLEVPTISSMDNHHVLLHLALERDYKRMGKSDCVVV